MEVKCEEETGRIACEHINVFASAGMYHNKADIHKYLPASINPERRKEMFGAIGMESVRVMEVIEIVALKGDGTEKDPVRKITQYWDMQGNFLAEYDPHLKELRDKKIVEAFNVETCKFDESLFDSPKEEPDSNDTPEMEELIENVKCGEKIPASFQSLI